MLRDRHSLSNGTIQHIIDRNNEAREYDEGEDQNRGRHYNLCIVSFMKLGSNLLSARLSSYPYFSLDLVLL